MTRPANSEAALQRTVVQTLRAGLPHGWVIQSTANKPRSAASGKLEKDMGALAGWPDLAVFGQDGAGDPTADFVELKSKSGTVSKEQESMHDRLRDLKFRVAVCRSLDDVLRFGRECGWPLKVTA